MVNDLGIELIRAYLPEARGQSERAFWTHEDRLVKELALEGDRESANRYLQETSLPAFNKEFSRPPREEHGAFVPLLPGTNLDAIFCERHDRVVGKDNCVQFDNPVLQLPPNGNRPHHLRTKVKVRRHMDGRLSVWHGPRLLGSCTEYGQPLAEETASAA